MNSVFCAQSLSFLCLAQFDKLTLTARMKHNKAARKGRFALSRVVQAPYLRGSPCSLTVMVFPGGAVI